MALQKVPVPINFAGGYGQKIDPKQLQIGKFKELKNSVFDKVGMLKKRNGFGSLTAVGATDLSSITTYSSSLVALGSTLNIFSEEQGIWLNKGEVNQVSLTTLSMVRSSTSQVSADASLSSSGLSLETWVDSDGRSKYQVNNSSNGQVLLNPVNLAVGAKSPRAFALNSHFIVTYLIATRLDYVAIPYSNLSNPLPVGNISSQVSSDMAGYDGIVVQGTLYLAWDGSDPGGAIRQRSLNSFLAFTAPVATPGHTADLLAISEDPATQYVWMTYWNNNDNNAYTSIIDTLGNPILAPTLVFNADIRELTSELQNGVLSVIYEVFNTYPSGVKSDYVQYKTVTNVGVVSSVSTVLRSVGIASKPFIQNDTIYLMLVYGGAFQPTYFISDLAGNIQAKLAYSNGGGYIIGQVLSNVTFTSSGNPYIAYLFKDLLLSVSKLNDSRTDSNIYSQTGVNTVTFDFNTPAYTVEIGNNLNLSGGFLSAYDGVKPTEQEFHVWPEDITAAPSNAGGAMSAQEYFYQVTYEWTDGQGNLFRSAPSVPISTVVEAGTPITFTSVFGAGDTTLTVSSTAGLIEGQIITDTATTGNIQPGTYIVSIGTGTIVISLPTVAASAGGPGDTLSTDNLGSVTLVIPTLRLTAKPLVRIVVYRFSVANQSYYMVSSITSPTLNNPSVDTVTYVDTQNDNAIVGNLLIYTTGGVIENMAPPSTRIMALFKSRLFLLDAEDQNLLWYSKQVLQATPVEMSDLFTIYVAPTIGASKSTGPITALGAMDDKLIVFKKDAAYYITGNGPDNTGTNNDFSDPTFIAGTVGCANQQSIVLIPNGLMFQSDKGIWLLNRNLGTSYIGNPVEDFTADSLVMSAIVIPGTNQVRFTLSSGVTLMYDYFVEQWGTFVNIPGISSTIYADMHTYLRSDGTIFQETPDLYIDGSNPTLMSFTTSWFNIAGLQGYQRAYQYYLLGTYLSPHLLQVQTAYDYDDSKTQSNIISPDNFSPPWGGDLTWGGSDVWGGASNSEQWRVDLDQQKCQSIQITVNEQYDSSFGVAAGAGFTMSGINLIMGAKSGYPRLKPTRIVGAS